MRLPSSSTNPEDLAMPKKMPCFEASNSAGLSSSAISPLSSTMMRSESMIVLILRGKASVRWRPCTSYTQSRTCELHAPSGSSD